MVRPFETPSIQLADKAFKLGSWKVYVKDLLNEFSCVDTKGITVARPKNNATELVAI